MENTTNVLAVGQSSREEQMVMNASMIPKRVDEQVGKLARLGRKVQEAVSMAERAENAAQQAGRSKKSGLFGIARADALETISDAVEALGKANMNNAQGLTVVYEFTQSLAEINEGLFGLAAMGIAANNTVMQQLEAKLKGASSSELTGIARSELKRTISILKNQSKVFEEQGKLKALQDAMQLQLKALSGESDEHARQNAEQDARLAAGEAKDAEHDRRLNEGERHDAQQDVLLEQHSQTDQEHAQLIAENMEKDAQQDELLAQHSQTDQEHAQLIAENMEQDARQDELIAENMEQDARQDQQIAANMEQDARQDELIAENMEQDARQDELIAENMEKDAQQDKLLIQHAEKDAEHDRLIAELQEENRTLRTDLEAVRTLLEQKTEKQFSVVTLAVAIAALLAAGVQFFL